MILFKRSVMMESRRMMPYIIRLALLSSLVYGIYDVTHGFHGVKSMGLYILDSVAHTNIILLFIIGAFFFSSPISEEREEGMLGLIEMTGISRFNLLASKFLSNFLSGMMLLVLQIPIVLLCITLGGVDLEQIVSIYLVLVAVLFFVCSVGLMSSVFARSVRSSVGVSSTLIAGYCFFPLLAYFFGSLFNLNFADIELLTRYISPFDAYYQLILGSRYYVQEKLSIYPPLCMMLLLSGVALLFAYRFYYVWSARRRGAGDFLKKYLPSRLKNGTKKHRRVWSHFPFMWKSFYIIGGGKWALLVRLILYGALYGVIYMATTDLEDDMMFLELFIAGVLLLIIESLLLQTKVLSYEKKEHAIAVLEMIPGTRLWKILQLLFGVFLQVILGIISVCIIFYLAIIQAESESGESALFYVALFVIITLASMLVLYFSLVMRYGATVVAGGLVFLLGNMLEILSRALSDAYMHTVSNLFFITVILILIFRIPIESSRIRNIRTVVLSGVSIVILIYFYVSDYQLKFFNFDNREYDLINFIRIVIPIIIIISIMIYKKIGKLSQV